MGERILDSGWVLAEVPDGEEQTRRTLEACFGPAERTYPLPAFPMQVHDVLLDAGVIENPNERGINRDLWIHERDWAYRCDFSAEPGRRAVLCLDGADTFADVWLNGTLIGSTEDVYLKWRWDVSAALQAQNRLIVRFRSSLRRVEGVSQEEKYRGLVPAYSALRVFRTGFHDYCGPAPCLIRCGLYAPVRLLSADPVLLEDASVRVDYDPETREGTVAAELCWRGALRGRRGTLTLVDPRGRTAASRDFSLEESAVALKIPDPALWYPRTHGTPEVYRLRLEAQGWSRTWTVGFRTLKTDGELRFFVNGLPVRCWGANLMHLDTLTNCYQAGKMRRMLDLAELANCNMLRIWGEADRLPEEFYSECDRRGILVWQDVFLGCSLYPEGAEYRAALAAEAEQMVLSLRHHPCVALWCGGNELYLARDYQHPESPCFGEGLVREVLRDVCRRLDPGRYYHPSSPSGGRWANDPAGGDTHGYTHLWFVPGRKYPVFLSENCRVSAPAMSAMRRMMSPEELWPREYRPGLTRSHPYEWPETWNRHTPNEGWQKLGPVEHYRDAETPEEMVYRVGMAHAEYIHVQVGRFRRGAPEPGAGRRTGPP